ncbi:hypothetical protein FRB91_004082 [Serendipita sp. 411]|nr:hypothetical protein FRB91_004082 [Serendipita sp. 411]
MERFKKNQPLYDLWYPDGKLVPADRARVAFNPLEPKGSNSGDKIFQAKNLFLSHCQIARLARVNEGLYDVLSRFWDGPWETSFILQIDPKYKDQIRKSAKAIATDEDIKNLDVNPKWEKEDIPMMALIENIKTERQFQPKLSILWSTGDIDQPNPSVISLDKWASHPNSLYSLWVDSKDHLDIMHKTKLPVWLPFRDGPSSDDLKASDKNFQDLLKSKGTYKDVKTAATTMTQVTKTSINVVKSYKRTPDQIGAMGGISPNDLVRKWWKLGQKEKAAEWLHRSAWSYGGLYDGGKLNPQSSQVMSNLVIGTHEANTLMIRHEIFVKRLAEYGKDPANKGVTVQVTTSLHKMFEETLPEYAWFCPRLHYKVETLGTPDVAANFTYDFYLLDRRLPTRLELDLDELLERLAYGWGNSDFMTL